MTRRIRWPWHNGIANKKLCTWTPSVQASDTASLRDTIPNPRGQTDLETDSIFLFSYPNLGQWPELTSHLCSARNRFWSFFDPALHSPRAMDRPQSAAPWPDHGKRSGSACSGVILLRNLRTLGALLKFGMDKSHFDYRTSGPWETAPPSPAFSLRPLWHGGHSRWPRPFEESNLIRIPLKLQINKGSQFGSGLDWVGHCNWPLDTLRQHQGSIIPSPMSMSVFICIHGISRIWSTEECFSMLTPVTSHH